MNTPPPPLRRPVFPPPRWVEDQLAFGTDNGGTWIISRQTGFVINVFEGHAGGVTGGRGWVCCLAASEGGPAVVGVGGAERGGDGDGDGDGCFVFVYTRCSQLPKPGN